MNRNSTFSEARIKLKNVKRRPQLKHDTNLLFWMKTIFDQIGDLEKCWLPRTKSGFLLS